MRVTQSMISTNLLKNLNKSYGELDKYMDQLNTGKKINRPSDDPVAAMNGMNYRTELAKVEQYQRNTNEVHNWFDNSDAAMEQMTRGLDRIRYLAVQASNGTYSGTELKNIAEEVKQIKLDLVDLANTNVNGKYIFNGTDTDVAPIKLDDDGNIIYATVDEDGTVTSTNHSSFNQNNVSIEVSSGTHFDVNVRGSELFGGMETILENGEVVPVDDMFSTIQNFIDNLESETPENIDQGITNIDKYIDKVINTRADLGARMNRLELVENRLSHQKVIATATLSKNEDVNYAEAITNLITQQSIHRAALSSGSQIIQPTLLDFLR
ncbi:flagellar hook-associated protein FlgL [Oceanobacillus sp. CAU 1775]